jgi:DNA-binding response OmpR family regulator
VVDDQPAVRGFTADALRFYGYRVMAAEGAAVALAICEQEQGGIDLVLTDVLMPNLSGKDLADTLWKRWPAIKVLFMSGYTGTSTRPAVLPEGFEFIQKPFSPDQLAMKVRETLLVPERVRRILVADDEAGVRGLLRLVLERDGYEVVEAANGTEAIKEVQSGHVDLLITDLVMPDREGIDTIRTLREAGADLRIIAMSGWLGGEFLNVARLMGADAVLSKPLNLDLLLQKVSDVLKPKS